MSDSTIGSWGVSASTIIGAAFGSNIELSLDTLVLAIEKAVGKTRTVLWLRVSTTSSGRRRSIQQADDDDDDMLLTAAA